MSRLGSQKKLTLVFNASSSSLSNCTSTFFECEYTVSILSKYVAFLSQNVTSNVIDRTKKKWKQKLLGIFVSLLFFCSIHTIHHLLDESDFFYSTSRI